MNIRRSLAGLLVALVASGAIAWADVPIVEKGKPRAVIVVADRATPVALYAAEELRAHIEKATGERLAISREVGTWFPDGWLEAGGRSLILVGDSMLAAAMGYETAKIDPEKLVVLIGFESSPSSYQYFSSLVGKQQTSETTCKRVA